MNPRSLAPLLLLGVLAGCERSPIEPVRVREYREGGQVQLNVQFGDGRLCSAAEREVRTGRVVVVSRRAIVVADEANPAGGFTDDHFRSLATTFDQQVWPTITGNFGEPHDIDGNGRVVLFFTRAVNELAPAGQRWYVGGVFAARDLFPLQDTRRLRGCGGSNHAELIYMPVPDPAGEINGNERERSSELRLAPGLLAHELQHVVNASRRLYGGRAAAAEWNEALWLNEGLSHIAEELMGYATSELAPGRNLGIEEFIASQPLQHAFSRYLQPNFQWLADYLENPDTTSLYGRDSRAARGAAWQFLRYAADRRGGSEAALWRSLIDAGSRVLDNLPAALGGEPVDWIHDWLVAVYLDDLLPGVHPRFAQPSWSYRNLYPNLRSIDGSAYGRYPLRTRTLADGATLSLTLAAGSAAYVRFGVAPDTRAEIRTVDGAMSCHGSGPARTMAIGEVVMLSGSRVEAFCVDGGPGGAEFTLVPFNAAASDGLGLSLRGTGVVPLTGASGAAAYPTSLRLPVSPASMDEPAHPDRVWESRFREREQRELSGMVAGASATSPQPSYSTGMSGGTPLRMAVVRTR